MLKIDILTLFPDMFTGPFDNSMVLAAKKKGLVEIEIHNLRKWAIDSRGSIDDRTYGGGKGMLIKVDVIDAAIKELKSKTTSTPKVILLDAAGEKFSQKKAVNFSKSDQIILICGHYEGIDHRVHEHLVDDIISVGDYVLTGGEIPAMIVTDAITRLIPGVLEEEATVKESHTIEGILEYPQYTRPENYKGWKVPEILKSGNHAEIDKWREENQKNTTSN